MGLFDVKMLDEDGESSAVKPINDKKDDIMQSISEMEMDEEVSVVVNKTIKPLT